MKKILMIVGLVALLGTLTRVFAAPAESSSFYQAGEFGVSLGADVSSADLDTGRLGYSGALRYYLTQNFGLGVAATSQRLDNDYRIAPLLLWRLPANRAALLMEAGPEFEIESEAWSLRVAVGPAIRLTKNIEASLTVGARKFFGSGRQGQSIESVTTAQMTFYFGGK